MKSQRGRWLLLRCLVLLDTLGLVLTLHGVG